MKRRAREKLRKWEEIKREKREEEEKTKKFLKTEDEVWRYINEERRRKTEVSGKIKIHEWKRHFMQLLGGCEEKCCKINKGIKTTEEMWRGSEITEDETERQIERRKRTKNESWKEVIAKYCKNVGKK